MIHLKNVRFFVQSNLAVVGNNSENADLDNPNGDIIREVGLLICEDDKGNRWIVQNLGEIIDPNALGWSGTHPAYGSLAYQECPH